MNREIPIFFSCNDAYIPFLDIAVRSLIDHASKEYQYKIIVLNTGLKTENMAKIKLHENENTQIVFANIKKHIAKIENNLRDVYHFSLASYYRLFIESLFPQYDRVIYLDCDIVVLGDISKLYFTDLKGNYLGGVVEQFIVRTPEFRTYVSKAIGIEAEYYINSGILLMDLAKFRENQIEKKFIEILCKYNFASICPDQDYINFLCQNKILYLDVSWNCEPIPGLCEKPNIIHYALYKKPWQYDDVYNGHYFHEYVATSQFKDEILKIRKNFDGKAKKEKELANIKIKEQGLLIANSECTFYNMLVKKTLNKEIEPELNWLNLLLLAPQGI